MGIHANSFAIYTWIIDANRGFVRQMLSEVCNVFIYSAALLVKLHRTKVDWNKTIQIVKDVDVKQGVESIY